MIHKMKLEPQHFETTKLGRKQFEVRLNDEKRKQINIKDIIEFENLENGEKLKVQVYAKTEHSSLGALLQSPNFEETCLKYMDSKKWTEVLRYYYSPYQEVKNGYVVFHFLIIEESIDTEKELSEIIECADKKDKKNFEYYLSDPKKLKLLMNLESIHPCKISHTSLAFIIREICRQMITSIICIAGDEYYDHHFESEFENYENLESPPKIKFRTDDERIMTAIEYFKNEFENDGD